MIDMALKIQDFQCEDCEKVTEVFLDKNDPDQKVQCEHCHSEKMKPILSIGTGKGSHHTWSKWRAGV